MRFEAELYETANGDCPVKMFLDKTETKMRAKTMQMIALLEEKGNELREPYSKPLSDGIFELRVKIGSDISRVLYFFVVGNKIVLTNGFIKKTQKTPRTEIERAKRYRADYLTRQHDNEETDETRKEN